MSPSSNPRLSDTDRALLSARADDFYSALSDGQSVDWEPYLSGLSGTIRLAVLVEFVIIDMVYQWESGARALVEDYLERFPELGPADRVPANLILEEHRCRVKAGEVADLDGYRERFPAQYSAIKNMVTSKESSTHSALSMGSRLPGAKSNCEKRITREYVQEKPLGEGQFGKVYLVRKRDNGIIKAIKILNRAADRSVIESELKALKAIKNIRHHFLLTTEDYWEEDNQLYIVMEVAECSLRARLKECLNDGLPGIPVVELLGYLAHAAEGLDYLHFEKIIHRDVKADNILLSKGVAKVADFGLARQHDAASATVAFAGTPANASPEVWRGKGVPASDLYALALTYAELRQGCHPIVASAEKNTLVAHEDGLFHFEPIIQDAEREVLLRALARSPKFRQSSCWAFVNELAGALELPAPWRSGRPSKPDIVLPPVPSGLIPPAPPRPKPPPPPPPIVAAPLPPLFQRLRPMRSMRLLIPIGVVALVLLGGIGFMIYSVIAGPREETAYPAPPKVLVPDGTTADSSASTVQMSDGRRLPEWIIAERHGHKVRFRLIVLTDATVRPFYIQESKVWNELHDAAGVNPRERLKPGGPLAPAVNLTADEAALFAEKVFLGRLPTPDEWDHAAGLYDRGTRVGPTRDEGTARVNLKEPAPTTGPDAGSDVNQYGLIDMAGNGREWTRAVVVPGDSPRVMEGSPTSRDDLVVLRGRAYFFSRPLTYAMLDHERTMPQTQYAGSASPYTGFRVVITAP